MVKLRNKKSKVFFQNQTSFSGKVPLKAPEDRNNGLLNPCQESSEKVGKALSHSEKTFTNQNVFRERNCSEFFTGHVEYRF